MAYDIVTIALVIALPLLFADVEGDTGRIDGDVVTYRTFQLPLNDAADLGGVLGCRSTMENDSWRTAASDKAPSP